MRPSQRTILASIPDEADVDELGCILFDFEYSAGLNINISVHTNWMAAFIVVSLVSVI